MNLTSGARLGPYEIIAPLGAGITSTGAAHFSRDGSAYTYFYQRTLSEAYVVTGLK